MNLNWDYPKRLSLQRLVQELPDSLEAGQKENAPIGEQWEGTGPLGAVTQMTITSELLRTPQISSTKYINLLPISQQLQWHGEDGHSSTSLDQEDPVQVI